MNNKSQVFYYTHKNNKCACDNLFLHAQAKKLSGIIGLNAEKIDDENIQEKVRECPFPIVLIMAPQVDVDQPLKESLLKEKESAPITTKSSSESSSTAQGGIENWHIDDSVKQMLSYPEAFFMICSSENEVNLLKRLRIEKEKSVIRYSFLCQDTDLNKNKKVIELLSKQPLFDPTGLRSFFINSLKCTNPDYSTVPKYGLVLEDQEQIADSHAYFLYRLDFSPLILTSIHDIRVIEDTYYIDEIEINLFDYEIMSGEGKNGGDLVKDLFSNYKYKINLLITAHDKEKITGTIQAEKPIIDHCHLLRELMEVEKFKKKYPDQKFYPSQKFRKQSDASKHKTDTIHFVKICKSLLKKDYKNDFQFLIAHLNAAHLLAGNEGALCLNNYAEVHSKEIELFHQIPIVEKYRGIWNARFKEIHSFSKIAFHKGMETQANWFEYKILKGIHQIALENQLPFDIQTRIRLRAREISIKFKLNNSIREIRKLFKLKSNRIRIRNIFISIVPLCANLFLQLISSFLLLINNLFFKGSVKRVLTIWLFFFFSFACIYFYTGNNITNEAILSGKLNMLQKSFSASLSGAFGLGVDTGISIYKDNTTPISNDVFIALGTIHSVIAYLLLAILIDILSQKSNEI